MTGDDDPIVEHKTFVSPQGEYSHTPLRQSEVDLMYKEIREAELKRSALYPTEADAIRGMFEAYLRLCELGWKDAIYCPKDGTVFNVVEPGSAGVHPCRYFGEWPTGHWMVEANNDLWPSRPCLFKHLAQQ